MLEYLICLMRGGHSWVDLGEDTAHRYVYSVRPDAGVDPGTGLRPVYLQVRVQQWVCAKCGATKKVPRGRTG